MQHALVEQLADENNEVTISDQSQPEIDISFDIRDDDFQLFESESGSLYIKTPDMDDAVFAEVVPTSEGPVTSVEVGVEMETLELCEPADREETPEVNASANADIIVD